MHPNIYTYPDEIREVWRINNELIFVQAAAAAAVAALLLLKKTERVCIDHLSAFGIRRPTL